MRTLGEIDRHGHGIWAFCETTGCGRRRQLDLGELIGRLGAGFDVTGGRLAGRLRCGACGAPGVFRIVSAWR
jgi:hypothetical protein